MDTGGKQLQDVLGQGLPGVCAARARPHLDGDGDPSLRAAMRPHGVMYLRIMYTAVRVVRLYLTVLNLVPVHAVSTGYIRTCTLCTPLYLNLARCHTVLNLVYSVPRYMPRLRLFYFTSSKSTFE